MSEGWIKIDDEIRFEPEIILNTFSENDVKQIEKFKLAVSLRKNRTKFKEISKRLGVAESCAVNWFFGDSKPPVIRSIEICKERNLLPIQSNSEKFITLLEIFSWIFGDGNLNVKFGLVNLFGKRWDFEKLAPKIVENFGFKCVIRENGNNNCTLSIQGKGIRAFARLLKSMGAPDGDKIKEAFLIPEWVFLLKPGLKKRFLEVFLSNEMCVKNFTRGDQFPDMGIKMRKMKDKEANLINFLNQIGSLLNEFGIETGNAKVVNEIVDKEGRKSDVFIRIMQNFFNVLRLTETFNLIFAKEKQKVFDSFNESVKLKLAKEFNLIKTFENVIKLKQRGLRQVEISKELGLPRWRVRSWVSGDSKPRFLTQKELFNQLHF